MLTNLEKKLIALSYLGIRIEHESGHRWILSTDTDYFNFESVMRVTGVHVCKVYGGVEEALDQVDSVLEKTSERSLLAVFETLVDNFGDDDNKEAIVTCRSR